MGNFSLQISPDAVAEARAARLWYAERSEKAGAGFVGELDAAIESIRDAPERWPVYVHGTRRFRMRRFPYLVVYRLIEDRIEVIAVQHGRRRPHYWKSRLKGA
jgi:plasmid stabilization system protein ParE